MKWNELTDEDKQRRAAAAREWRKANPERVKERARLSNAKPENKARRRAYQAKWAAQNRERLAEHSRNWYAQNRERAADTAMRRTHNISLDDYARLLDSQGGCCAVCGSKEPGKGERFAIDHDHACCPGERSCGKCIRGLLCVHCNVGLGHFRDNGLVLLSAMLYLSRPPTVITPIREDI